MNYFRVHFVKNFHHNFRLQLKSVPRDWRATQDKFPDHFFLPCPNKSIQSIEPKIDRAPVDDNLALFF